MRTLLCVVSVFFLASVCASNDASAQLYQFTDLGTISGGTTSGARGINASGQVVGYSYTGSGGPARAFLYSNGVMSELNNIGTNFSDAYDINDNGDIVGRFYINGGYRPFLYSSSNGTMRNLGTLGYSGSGGTGGIARSINASGQVTGDGNTADITPHAFLYTNNLMFDVTPNLFGATAGMGINDNGLMVGNNNHTVFVYASGMPGPGYIGVDGDPYGINNSGHIVGYSLGHSFFYHNGITENIGPGAALGINNLDQVVGTTTPQLSSGFAYLYSNGQFRNLNSLAVGLPPSWNMTEATAINDSGQIVGKVTTSEGYGHAFLLTPIPTPATLSLLMFSSLIISRRKR